MAGLSINLLHLAFFPPKNSNRGGVGSPNRSFWMPHVVINPFPPLPTQNGHSGQIVVAERLFTGNFLALLGSHLGHFEAGI